MVPMSLQGRGNRTLTLTVTGAVNTETHTGSYQYVQRIIRSEVGVVITPHISSTVAVTQMCMTVGTGSHISYGLTYGDGATGSEDDEMPVNETPTCVTHTYGVGHFTLVVTVSNVLSTETFEFPIQSLQPIDAMSMVVNAVYDMGSGPFQLVVDLGTNNPLATNVTCDIAFSEDAASTTTVLTGKRWGGGRSNL